MVYSQMKYRIRGFFSWYITEYEGFWTFVCMSCTTKVLFMLNMVANIFCVGDLVSCYSLKRTPGKRKRDFKPSNLSLWQMVHAKTGLVSQRDHPKSAYYQKVVVKIAQWNLEESMLWNTFMIISESLLDLWSAFHCYVLGDSSYMSFMLGKVPLESWRSLLKRHCWG